MGDHMAPLSAHHTYAEESGFKRPHPPSIDGIFGRIGGWHVEMGLAELWCMSLGKIAR
jgi:hypothetical protein